MLRSINIKNFKCFKNITLETPALTVLTGFNASGKSTAMQALTLLHQDACEARDNNYLCLNGQMIHLGGADDVLNKQHAKGKFSISLNMKNGQNDFSFIYDDVEKYFVKSCQVKNKIKNKYDWDFKKLSKDCQILLEGSTYISADRLGPQETYSMDYSPAYGATGARGERAIKILYEYADNKVHSNLCYENTPSYLAHQTTRHMQELFPGFKMDIQPVNRTNFATLGLTVSDSIGFVRPQNIGFGLSCTLSVIVAGLIMGSDEMLMVENPEIHLHPRGQSYMGNFLAHVASSDTQVMFETHSDHVLNGVRKAVKGKVLSPNDVAIYFFNDLSSDGEPNIEHIPLKADGSVEAWPEGFFDQYDKDLDELIDWKA